jgi:hypothetical protein
VDGALGDTLRIDATPARAQNEAHVEGYTQLANGLTPGGEFVGFMFGGDEVDEPLADLAWDAGKPLEWRPLSSTEFVPASHVPAPGKALLFSVSWRREGRAFVVREITTPF